MLGQLGWGELMLLVVVGLFVFGPERLPGVLKDAGKVFRQLRDMARDVRTDLQSELGPELADLDLQSLNPRSLIEKHLLGDDDDEPEHETPKVRKVTTSSEPAAHVSLGKADPPQAAGSGYTPRSDATPYDEDAT